MASPAVNKSKTEELGGDSTPSRNKATAALSPKGSLVGTPGTPAAKGSGKKKKRGSGDKSANSSVQVCVRVRPLNPREVNSGAAEVWQWDEDSMAQLNPTSGKALGSAWAYSFDKVFSPDSNTEDLYRTMAAPLVADALVGINGTIFAYGQTSSGKTHTMTGTDDCPGIIPSAIDQVFSTIASTPDREFLLRCSYLEIYNEQCKDLLADPDSGADNLKVHESAAKGIYVGGLKEEFVVEPAQMSGLLARGNSNRQVGATQANDRSSRSHTIFRIVVESRARSEAAGAAVTVGTLNLVDLAGSERAKVTGAEGLRLKEGGHINQSLLTLALVIQRLSEGASGHIPYRDSKLTRILQPSLGGNARLAIICTVTPASVSSEETTSTLKFATRAKRIKNKPIVNEVMDEATQLKKCKSEIANLQKKLKAIDDGNWVDEDARAEVEVKQAEIEKLQRMILVSSSVEAVLETAASSRTRRDRARGRRVTWAAPVGASDEPVPAAELEGQVERLRETAQSASAAREAAEKKAAVVDELKEEVQRLESDLVAEQAKVSEFEEKAQSATAAREAAEKKASVLEELKEEVQRLESELVAERAKVIEYEEEANATVEITFKANDLAATNAGLMAEIAALKAVDSENRETLAGLELSVQELAGEVEESSRRAEAAEGELKEARDKLKALKKAGDGRKELEAAEREKDKAKDRASQLLAEKSSLTSELAALKSEHKTTLKQLKAAESEAEKSKTNQSAVKEATAAASAAEKRADAATKASERATAMQEEQASKIEELEVQLEELRKQAAEATERATAAETLAAEKEAEATSANEEAAAQSSKAEASEQAMAAAEERAARAEETAQAAVAAQAEAEQVAGTATESAEKAKSEAEEAREALEVAEEAVTAMKESIEAAQKEAAEAAAKATEQLSEAMTEAEFAREEAEMKWNGERAELEGRISQLETDLSELKDEKEARIAADARVGELEAAVRDSQARLVEMETAKYELEQSHKQLQTDFEAASEAQSEAEIAKADLEEKAVENSRLEQLLSQSRELLAQRNKEREKLLMVVKKLKAKGAQAKKIAAANAALAAEDEAGDIGLGVAGEFPDREPLEGAAKITLAREGCGRGLAEMSASPGGRIVTRVSAGEAGLLMSPRRRGVLNGAETLDGGSGARRAMRNSLGAVVGVTAVKTLGFEDALEGYKENVGENEV